MSFLRLSNTEASMLQLLVDHGELYGLQMLSLEPTLKRGSIYVTLSRMASKGYVSSRTVKDVTQAGLPRRLFSPTGLGRRVLNLSQSVAADQLGAIAYA